MGCNWSGFRFSAIWGYANLYDKLVKNLQDVFNFDH